MRVLRYVVVIVMSCVLGLTGCATIRPYDRHLTPAFDDKGMRKIGYGTIDLDYLDAMQNDLDACYRDHR